jgi:hypothetical protein
MSSQKYEYQRLSTFFQLKGAKLLETRLEAIAI